MKTTWPVSIVVLFIFLFLINPAAIFAQVKINEVFPDPVNEDDEFVELYNSTDDPIILTGYKLADLSKTYTIPEVTMTAKSFYVLNKSETKIILNNDGDETVSLKNNLDQVIDSFSYNGATEEKSFSRIPDGGNQWMNNTIVTKNQPNQAPPSPSPSPSPSPQASPSPEAQASSSPIPSPAASKMPSPTPKASASPSPEPEPTPEEEIIEESPQMLGASDSAKPANPYRVALVLIGLGLALIGSSVWGIMKHGKMAKS